MARRKNSAAAALVNFGWLGGASFCFVSCKAHFAKQFFWCNIFGLPCQVDSMQDLMLLNGYVTFPPQP